MPLMIFIVLLVAGWIAYRYLSKLERRKRLLGTPLSDAARQIVQEQVPIIRRLPADLQTRLEGKINLFLDQVSFHGCDGLVVTKDMELSIAAQASLVVVNSDAWYHTLRTILIYPGAFKSQKTDQDGYVVTQSEPIRSGESWARGPVVLSWAHSEQGAENEFDGHNVVFHEFAHQLDNLSGHTDGAPLLRKGQSFAKWRNVFLTAYDRHVAQVQSGRRTVLDEYGATAHEEFFAVAVEVFFEKPRQLKQEEPEVYAQISELLGLDPLSWH